jgi:hypothetical protein
MKKCGAVGCGSTATSIPVNQIGKKASTATWRGRSSCATFVVCDACKQKLSHCGISWTRLTLKDHGLL